jgi:[acyl-carrier-protein] S-malonyltransferase
MKIAFLYPGQGAQQIGMGRDLCETFPAAREIFDKAEAVTGLPIKKLCFEGPDDELARTDVCQPAIFTTSAALLACLRGVSAGAALSPAFHAGLSLGEYTALYAAGAMDLGSALKLVARRGRLMQDAATAVPSGMVSVMGLDEAKAQELCRAAGGGEVLTCANFNCPGQIVLSGQIEACKRAEAMAKDFGASGAVALKVAGAFHSAIMQPAAEALSQAMAQTNFSAPAATVIANVDAVAYNGAGEIPAKLLAQLTGAVRWQQSMEFLLAQGVERFYEIGPGRVLAGLMKRIQRRAEVVNVNSREALEKLAQA